MIAVFARAPRPGRTKTRLIPALGPDGAAALYAAFLDDTLRTARSVGVPVVLWAAGDADARELARRHPDVPLHTQPEGADLGARMHAALAHGLTTHPRVVLIGSDAPTLPRGHLDAAFRGLESHDTVLGPASDGGYVLVGARGSAPSFGAARWSTRHALADTLESFSRQGLTTRVLPPWYDVDEPSDLATLRMHLALRPDRAPATAEALRRATFDRTVDGE